MELRYPFYQNQMYHIYNCGNGNEPVFRCEQNYEFFMRKYHAYMDSLWDLRAWCLMPGQFHFLVSVKPSEMGTVEHSRIISRTFGDFCNGYVQSYNKMHHRKGSLLRRAFKRCMVYKPDDLRNLLCFLHNHPVAGKLVDAPQSWSFSSYRHFAYADSELFQSDPLLRLFGNKREFLRQHKIQLSGGALELPYVTAAA